MAKRKLTEKQVEDIMIKMSDLISEQMQMIEEVLLKETKDTLHLWLNQEVDDSEEGVLII